MVSSFQGGKWYLVGCRWYAGVLGDGSAMESELKQLGGKTYPVPDSMQPKGDPGIANMPGSGYKEFVIGWRPDTDISYDDYIAAMKRTNAYWTNAVPITLSGGIVDIGSALGDFVDNSAKAVANVVEGVAQDISTVSWTATHLPYILIGTGAVLLLGVLIIVAYKVHVK